MATTFQTSYQYDTLGRQSLVRYPAVRNSQLAVGYHYTSLGHLQYLTDESSDYSILWQAKEMNALGQVIDEQTRNGVETAANRNSSTGWLMGSTSTAHSDGNTVIQKWSYGFDEIGNLLTRNRTDQVNDAQSTEVFGYDILNRLVSSQVTVGSSVNSGNYAYDTSSNLVQKDGKTYSYGGCAAGARTAGPNAVCSVGSSGAYVYDDNGSLTSSGSRTVMYNAHHKASEIVSDPVPSQGNDTGTVDFAYGADENRVVQAVKSGTATSRTVYVGLGGTGKSMYERTTTGSTVQHVNFIYAGGAHGGNAFAVRTMDVSGSVTGDRYFGFDHLGSTTAVSDEKGHIASASGPDAGVLGYDPWGARRNPDGTPANPVSFNAPVGSRAFTGQETIPDVGLINMNGRVYDPVLARFLSPDPDVQDSMDPQNYNRYGYVVNNPLRYSDPTGYNFIDDYLGGVRGFLGAVGNYLENPGNDFWLLSSVVICGATSGAACGVWALLQLTMNVASAVDSGASFNQTATSVGIGVGFGVLTMGVGNALGGGVSSVVAGTISAAASTALTDVALGHGPGLDVAVAAFMSAAQGAMIYGLQQSARISQASQSGDRGGGSGEDYEEKLETLLAANTSGRSSADLGDELLMDLEKESGENGNPSEPLACASVRQCVGLGIQGVDTLLGSPGSLIKLLKVNPIVLAATILLTESKAGIVTPSFPVPAYPGNDPSQSPGPDWTWKGRPGSQPGSADGSYTRPNPSGGRDEYLRPDLNHPPPIGPHWDWRDPGGDAWRVFPDGTVKPK